MLFAHNTPLILPLIRICTVTLLAAWCSGFVLAYGPFHSKLPATPEKPDIYFTWNGQAPYIHKLTFEGPYTELEGLALENITKRLIQEGLKRWSEVPGSYLRMHLETVDHEATMSTSDNVNLIHVGKQTSTLMAAYAIPYVDLDGDVSVIKDCDINIAPESPSIKALDNTISHELGHCVGLGHPHSSYSALMSYSTSRTDLAVDDMAGVVFLYPENSASKLNTLNLNCGSLASARTSTSSATQNTTTNSPWPLWILLLPLLCLLIPSPSAHKPPSSTHSSRI